MKHLRLFENFEFISQVESMLQDLRREPAFSHYNLVVENDPESLIHMIYWTNPADDKEWMESGYADDYEGDFSEVKAMPVLGVFSLFEDDLFAYTLSPEEKTLGKIVVTTKDDLEYLDEDQIIRVRNLSDFKRALNISLWEMY